MEWFVIFRTELRVSTRVVLPRLKQHPFMTVFFVFIAILGGAMRPGYSHLSDTISELFSPGSPNKLLLDTLHTLYAVLLVLFGIGVLQLVRTSHRARLIGTFGASAVLAPWMFSRKGYAGWQVR